MVSHIDNVKGEIENLKVNYERYNARKMEVTEEKKDLVENLKRI
jgi:hypothetical protein